MRLRACERNRELRGEWGKLTPQKQLAAGEHLTVSMPYMRAENPISRANREGTDVAPDIAVSADNALDHALEDARRRLSGR